ncbi:MAG: hypothetical protein FWH21_00570 [Kiritimatiellaeota bacterium]|nr:hypothetical protein [Kiritimatiellota bacterium]
MKGVMLPLLGAVVLSGCASSIKTTFTQYSDGGKPLASGTTSISGWSDKVFQSTGEGLFVDMAKGSEGAGLKSAATKVEGSGFAETFKGIGDMMGGVAALMAQMQGMALGGGASGGNSGVNGGNALGGGSGVSPSGPAQVALPEGDAVWIICGPLCARCNTLRKNLAGATEVEGLAIRIATQGESPYYDALLRVAFSCQTGQTVAYPYVIVASGGNRDCAGRLMTLTLDGLAQAVKESRP